MNRLRCCGEHRVRVFKWNCWVCILMKFIIILYDSVEAKILQNELNGWRMISKVLCRMQCALYAMILARFPLFAIAFNKSSKSFRENFLVITRTYPLAMPPWQIFQQLKMNVQKNKIDKTTRWHEIYMHTYWTKWLYS